MEEKNASTTPSVDVSNRIKDNRLKSILPLIKMQLIPFQEAIAEFAKVMIDDMNNL
jgi:hypothetical protein